MTFSDVSLLMSLHRSFLDFLRNETVCCAVFGSPLEERCLTATRMKGRKFKLILIFFLCWVILRVILKKTHNVLLTPVHTVMKSSVLRVPDWT